MRTRRRYEGPLAGDPRIARLLRVQLRLPRELVEEVLRAQCYVEVTWYAVGVRKRETTIVGGKPHGTVTAWFVNGSRASECPYVNGVRHGTALYWSTRDFGGALESTIPFVDDKRHGTAMYWRTDGSRWGEIPYVNDERHGTATWWRADGATVDKRVVWVHGRRTFVSLK